MKISLNKILETNQRYGSVGNIAPHGIDELVEKIGAQLGGVDEVIDFGTKYQGIVIVKVVSCEKHPDADKLNICIIDDNRAVKDVKRDDNGFVQIVCGAPNVHAGMLAVWLPPGLTVPATVDNDPLILEARDIRGRVSNGMLASSKELGLSDDHSGILEVADNEAKPGDDFAKIFSLDDYIIDIENKMFTHRPDLFGFMGVARELAGIQQLPYKSPDWYVEDPSIPGIEAEALPLTVKNDVPELVPRFVAIAMSGVKVRPSPLWLQIFLAKMGQKSINNIVDYTNFFMLETGQPLHAYDYDKVKARSNGETAIVVRYPAKDETVKLLNGKEIKPRDKAIMIATDKELIGLGGVMGGADTEVDAATTAIIIESANFDMYSIRRTAMEHGLFTDAVTRFTKGQSPLQNVTVLAKIVDEIRSFAGGKVASQLIDSKNETKVVPMPTIGTDTQFINARLGLELSAGDIAGLLQNVECIVTVQGNAIAVTPPFWRTDIEIPEDIVEEVGRLYGYDRLPLELPKHSIVPVGPDSMLRLKQELRQALARFGANEVLTYSFVHDELFSKVSQNKDEAYTISNALSPDLQQYRLSLTPSLLSHVHPNSKAGFGNFALFELGKTHNKTQALDDDVPKETDTLALVITTSDKNRDKRSGSPFYQARAYLDQLAKYLGLELVYYPATRDPGLAMTAPFNLDRAAFVTIKDSKGMLGIVGEYKQSVQKHLKLPVRTSGFEVGVKELLSQLEAKTGTGYTPLSRFPGTWQDVCFQVAPTVAYSELYQLVKEDLSEVALASHVEAIDIYQPESGEYKNITLRIHLNDHTKTIGAADAKAVIDQLAALATSRLGAKII